MERDELRSMWFEVHKGNQPKDNQENIEKVIGLKHSRIIAKVLSMQKKKIIVYTICFAVFLGLMAYAFLYQKVNLSVLGLVPLFLSGLFLILKMASEINRYRILTKTDDDASIRDSILSFQKKVNKIKTIDFIFNMFFFYAIAIGLTITILNDQGSIYLFNTTGMIPFLITFIFILLSVPWFIKYLYNQKYKRLYQNLRNSLNNLVQE